MDRRIFLKGMLYSGIVASSSDDLFSKMYNMSKAENRDGLNVCSRSRNPNEIKLIGVGGCGINVVNAAIKCGLNNVDFSAIDTDVEDLKWSNATNKIHVNSFMSSMIDGHIMDDAALDPNAKRKMLSPYAAKLLPLIGGAEKIFIVAGLAGETGTIVAPLIAEMAHKLGASTTAIVTFPFGFEGLKRRCIAQDCLAAMEQHPYDTILIVNDRVINKQDKLLECFSRCDQHMVKVIENSIF